MWPAAETVCQKMKSHATELRFIPKSAIASRIALLDGDQSTEFGVRSIMPAHAQKPRARSQPDRTRDDVGLVT